ncbi:MAG TPA: radical SAM protein, partial [Phototrophicaceae bacterium]|nr:radical SAM protein [Phototrophicaceae bacterium]
MATITDKTGTDKTIIDKFNRPLRDLRISVTDRCNFRCAYCMPAEIFGDSYKFLPREQLLTFEEITRVARLMVGMGVKKLRLTGGEPLVRHDIEKLVAMLSQIEDADDIALTTNGYLLLDKAQALKDAGL